MKRQHERRLVERFLQIWAEGTCWRIVEEAEAVEAPDAMLESDSLRVGLEVTSATLPHFAKAKSVEDRIIALANNHPRGFPPVSILLSFDGARALEASGRENQTRAAEQLLSLAAEFGEVAARVEVEEADLVARGMTWVRHVAIAPYPPHQVMRAGYAARGPRARPWIQASIDKKSEKLDAYRRSIQERGGSQAWLLVSVGEGRQDSIMVDRYSVKQLHRAAFDRAFVLDLFENKVAELSVRP